MQAHCLIAYFQSHDGSHRMTPEGTGPPAAKRILASWLRAGWKTGAILGGTYGAAYAAALCLATTIAPASGRSARLCRFGF